MRRRKKAAADPPLGTDTDTAEGAAGAAPVAAAATGEADGDATQVPQVAGAAVSDTVPAVLPAPVAKHWEKDFTPKGMIKGAFLNECLADPYGEGLVNQSWHPAVMSSTSTSEATWIHAEKLEHGMDVTPSPLKTGVIFVDSVEFKAKARGDKVETKGIRAGKGRVSKLVKGALCFLNVKAPSGDTVVLVMPIKFILNIYGGGVTRIMAIVTNVHAGAFIVVSAIPEAM